MSKAQIRIVVILAAMIAFLLLYVVLVHPWERISLLEDAANLHLTVRYCGTNKTVPGVFIRAYTSSVEYTQTTNNEGRATFENIGPDTFNLELIKGNTRVTGSADVYTLDITQNYCIPITEIAKVLFQETNVGNIGKASAEEINSYLISDLSVSYPQTQEVLSTILSRTLVSNVLFSASQHYDLKADLNNTQKVRLSFVSKNIQGTPSIKVVLNNQEIFHETASEKQLSIDVFKDQLKEDNALDIFCVWQGWAFWSGQSCELQNLTLTKYEYDERVPVQTMDFNVNEEDLENAYSAKLRFIIKNSNPNGYLKVYVNDDSVYSGKPESGSLITESLGISGLNLRPGRNTITFEAGQGGEYSINDIILSLHAANTTEREATYSFQSPEIIQQITDNIFISLNITEITLNGILSFNLKPAQVTYELSSPEIGLNSITINIDDIYSTNTLRLFSPNGRFTISSLQVGYE